MASTGRPSADGRRETSRLGRHVGRTTFRKTDIPTIGEIGNARLRRIGLDRLRRPGCHTGADHQETRLGVARRNAHAGLPAVGRADRRRTGCQLMKRDYGRYGKIVKELGLKVE